MSHLKSTFSTKCIILVILLFVSPIGSSEEKLVDRAKLLNQEIYKLLRVSPMSLSYLMQVSRGSYYPLEYYRETGRFRYFKELEKEGYIRIKIEQAPDEILDDERMFRVILTKKGNVVQIGLSQPKVLSFD